MKEKNGRSKPDFKNYFSSYDNPEENIDTSDLLYAIVTKQ